MPNLFIRVWETKMLPQSDLEIVSVSYLIGLFFIWAIVFTALYLLGRGKIPGYLIAYMLFSTWTGYIFLLYLAKVIFAEWPIAIAMGIFPGFILGILLFILMAKFHKKLFIAN